MNFNTYSQLVNLIFIKYFHNKKKKLQEEKNKIQGKLIEEQVHYQKKKMIFQKY